MSAPNKRDAQPDRESLMALHALLQIRSESTTSTSEDKSADQDDDEPKVSKPARKKAKKRASNAEPRTKHEPDSTPQGIIENPRTALPSPGLLRSLSASVSFGQTGCTRQSLAHMQNMNGQPMHGFLNPTAMSSSAAQISAAISALMQPSSLNITQRLLSSQLQQAEAAAHLSNSSFCGLPSNKPFSPQVAPGITNGDVASLVGDTTSTAKDTRGVTPATSPSPTPEELIRREEVEAALKSKPQRGRKRENLNVLERLELTRTRNREHAKSTRIRKKQRYQELVDNERRLQELQSAEDLNLERQRCVIKFVSIREDMLNKLNSGSAEDKPMKPASTGSNKETVTGRQRGSVSFCDLEDSIQCSEPSKEKGPETKVAPTLGSGTEGQRGAGLKEVIENLSSFQFNSSPLGAPSWIRPEGVHALPGIIMMKRFDNSILSLLRQHLSDTAIPALTYRVDGLMDGVAVNAHGKGFAQVDLTVRGTDNSPHRSQPLLSSILTFQFAQDSAKLTSVEWTVVTDRLSIRSCDMFQGGQDSKSDDSGESLGSQTVYPSVVSLEHHNMTSSGSDNTDHLPGNKKERSQVQQQQQHDVEEGHGPGMNI